MTMLRPDGATQRQPDAQSVEGRAVLGTIFTGPVGARNRRARSVAQRGRGGSRRGRVINPIACELVDVARWSGVVVESEMKPATTIGMRRRADERVGTDAWAGTGAAPEWRTQRRVEAVVHTRQRWSGDVGVSVEAGRRRLAQGDGRADAQTSTGRDGPLGRAWLPGRRRGRPVASVSE